MLTSNRSQPRLNRLAFLCPVPGSDALCHQLFEAAHPCKAEFRTAPNPPGSAAIAGYSLYQQGHRGAPYSEATFVADGSAKNWSPSHVGMPSGPFHDAGRSACFVLFDRSFSDRRAPVCLSALIEPLLGRMVFLWDRLQSSV